MNGHFDHPTQVDDRLFEACEDSAAFFQPPDKAFNDIAITICVSIKLDRAIIAILVRLRWNHRLDIQVREILINPIRTIDVVFSNASLQLVPHRCLSRQRGADPDPGGGVFRRHWL